ncbi:MAG: C1 family peptidase [Chloroflexota bacterium]
MKKITHSIPVLLVIAILLVIFSAPGTERVFAQDVSGQWSAEIVLSPEQTSFAQDSSQQLASSLQAAGVTRSLAKNNLQLSGSVGLDQLRSALFDQAAPYVDFLGGPVELTLVLPAGTAPVILQLEARLTAGYRWEVLPGVLARYAPSGPATFVTRYRGYGVPSIQTIQLKSSGTGDQTVHLIYRRAFEKDAPIHARVNLNMAQSNGLIEISDPTPQEPTSSASEGQGSSGVSPLDELQALALPTSFDWRTQGIVPAVRNQGSCGSCWAFGTVAVMESAIKMGGGALTDLSEQFLISCNTDGWSCGGGLTASKYHTTTFGKSQTASGAVLESVKPYTATNGTCSVVLPHAYKADSWKFIVVNEFTMPTVDQIKTAIYTYGPVTAGVCAGSGWSSYTGGVFSIDETSQCSGSTNHQIVLVGWDDVTQSWILRNSWGSGWGIGGYMNIKYGVSRVGEGTSWIKYIGAVLTPTAIIPATTTPTRTATRTPTFTATAISSSATRTPTFTATVISPGTLTPSPVFTSTAILPIINTLTTMPTSTVVVVPSPTGTLSSAIPVAYAPAGDTYTASPTYSWSMLGAAASYRLRVKDVVLGTYPIDGLIVSSSLCNASTNRCSVTPGTALAYNRNYQWQVAAGSGIYSSIKSIRPVTGFNSQFNGSAVGWLKRPGGSWPLTASTYYTNGLVYRVSSIGFNQTFGNFTYQARLKRVGTSGYSSGLIVRGSPVFGYDNDWLTSYQFLYRQDGSFSVWRGINGNWSAIQPWTYSSTILKNDWNILKVIADGSQFQFLINGTQVWSGKDASLATGQVGIWTYSSAVQEKLEVDWATLGMSELYTAVRRIDKSQVMLSKHFNRFGKPLK